MTNKMTKKDAFTAIAAVLREQGQEELAVFMDKEVERLKNSANSLRKPTANQQANVELKNDIEAFLSTTDEPKRICEIIEGVETLNSASNQKVNSLLIQLRKEGRVKKVMLKKEAFFTIGNENEENTDAAEA